MAAKLVIIKQKRPSVDVQFFSSTTEQKAALTATNISAVAGERNFKGGLTKIRTIFFPTVELFDAWQANDVASALTAERSAYNASNEITESQRIIDMPNLVV